MRRNSYHLAALASAGIAGVIPVATRLTSAPGEDIDSALVLDDHGRSWIVDAPTDPASGARVAKDIEVLTALAGTELAPLIQSPQGFAAMPEGGRAVIALALEGTPLSPDGIVRSPALASDIGRVLATVHNTPSWATDEAGIEEFSTAQIREQHRANILRANSAHKIPGAVAQRWKLMLMDDALWQFTPRFTHGALADERILTVGSSVSGLLSWDNAAIGDPATDVAWMLSTLDSESFDTFYTAYSAHLDIRPDSHLLERSQLAGEFAVLEWLLAGLDTGNDEIVNDALAMLQDVDDDLAEIARLEAEQQYEGLERTEDSPKHDPAAGN